MPHTHIALHIFSPSRLLLTTIIAALAVLMASLSSQQNSSPLQKMTATNNRDVSDSGTPMASSSAPLDQQTRAKILESYGNLPLNFEANQGQIDKRVNYLSRGNGYTVFLTPTEAVLKLRGKGNKAVKTESVLRMKISGANDQAQATALNELPGKSNYFPGKDSTKWRTNISHYAKVQYQGVYPGIDLVYYGNQRQLEYDFVLAPGAKPDTIRLSFDGAEKIGIDADGALVLHTNGGEVRQPKPIIYQEIAGVKKSIAGGYVVAGEREVRFEVGAYDAAQPLVIDPTLVYSTLLGGSYDDASFAIAVDAGGNAYVAGATDSPDFPATLVPGISGAYNGGTYPSPPPAANTTNALVTKLNPSGTALIYSTYIGGSMPLPPPPYRFPSVDDEALGIAVDSTGNAYIMGTTHTSNFPTTANALMPTAMGTAPCPFVTKLNASGSALLYSTYLGGGGPHDVLERGHAIAVIEPGIAVVTGYTNSDHFPTTPGAFQTAKSGGLTASDAFITKLNTQAATGPASLLYSTYLGGKNFTTVKINGKDEVVDTGVDAAAGGIAVDCFGDIYVVGETSSPDFPITANAFDATYNGGDLTDDQIGQDAFIAKISPLGNGTADLIYSSFIGGSGDDFGNAIAVDNRSNAYITGSTTSTNFPTKNAFQGSNNGGALEGSDAFVTKIATTQAGANSLVYSTYLGGHHEDQAFGIVADCTGAAYVVGFTIANNPLVNVNDFPVTGNAFDPAFNGVADVFVSVIAPSGSSLLYSTYLGGAEEEFGLGIALDKAGNFYVTGFTASPAAIPFPTTTGPFQVRKGDSDGFIAKFTYINPSNDCNVCRPPSDQKTGSVLVYPYYKSNTAGTIDTRITLSNTGSNEAIVHLFLIEKGCSQADWFLCLTPNASFSFKASAYDPEMTGYILAVAVDKQGRPIQNNVLIGNAFVKDGDYVDNYGAEAFWAFADTPLNAGGSTATLAFGVNYDAAPNQFAIEVQSPVNAPGQRVVTSSLNGDLTTGQLNGAAQVGAGVIYNGNEKPFGSFSAWLTGTCQAQGMIGSTSPRIPLGMLGLIPSGQTGTMTINVGAGVGLLMTPNTAKWSGIRTLHTTRTTRASLTIPIYLPSCP